MNIAIASGKGGTGKTFVSTNLFWVIQSLGLPVSLVDCDAEEPNVTQFISGYHFDTREVTHKVPVIDIANCKFCGKCHEYCHYNAIVYLPDLLFVQVVEDLCHSCGACLTACKHGAVSEYDKTLGSLSSSYLNTFSEVIEGRTEIGVYAPVPVIKKAIAGTEVKHLNILDAPPGTSCPFVATVENADFVVLVTEPTPFGLHDLELSVETLQCMKKSFGVVINREGFGDASVHNWLKENDIPLLLSIPFHKEIAKIYASGELLVKKKPEYRELFVQLFNRIINQQLYHD